MPDMSIQDIANSITSGLDVTYCNFFKTHGGFHFSLSCEYNSLKYVEIKRLIDSFVKRFEHLTLLVKVLQTGIYIRDRLPSFHYHPQQTQE